MTPPNLQLTPKQEEALIHYAKQRMARHRSHLDKRPPLWLQLIATVGFIVFGVAMLIYAIRHSSF
jgi:hypothetical protein